MHEIVKYFILTEIQEQSAISASVAPAGKYPQSSFYMPAIDKRNENKLPRVG